ncbi:hypothetical protein ACHAXA_002865 [Cyclostephanos tholiformis]|uniref:Uncharacterized protein n=1 Tax=Cyclostephanos tholiformis TaxID=382380 RepID=A0ABD3SBG8_9STRA
MPTDYCQGPWSPSASGSSLEPGSRPGIIPAAAEISPGDGAFSPPNDDIEHGDSADIDDVGFGPPPAFPTSNKKSLGKRKHTLIAVSATAGEGGGATTALNDDSGDEYDKENKSSASGSRGRSRQSQMIHRIKKGGDSKGGENISSPKSSQDDNDGVKKQYYDAMLLASLSDVEVSPKTKEEEPTVEITSPKSSANPSSAAPTPVRSNVNSNTTPVSIKPCALMPKAGPTAFSSTSSKRGGMVEAGSSAAAAVKDSHSPRNVSDHKAVTPMSEKGPTGEGPTYSPHHPQQHPYPPGYNYPGYTHPHAPLPHHAHASAGHGHLTYPGYPYGSYHAPYPQGPPGSAGGMMAGGAPSPYYHPRPYYPPGHPAHAPPTSSSSSSHNAVGESLDRWNYSHQQQASGIPETVHSNNDPSSYHHPHLSRSKSHVVPSEDGEPVVVVEGGYYARPPHPVYGLGPPPSMRYPDSRYGPPPPHSRVPGGYYPGQPVESYKTISGDDGSPPRTSSSYAASGQPEEYPPAVDSTPPRGGGGHYDPFRDQPPPIHHGSPYHPPPTAAVGYLSSDSPPMPSYQNHPAPYGGPIPPPDHDPYEPYEYPLIAPPPHPAEARYQVPATVTNEVEPHLGGGRGPPLTPPASSGWMGNSKHHQFRKGGRSIHSEPVILRKKFSWRNYPELEEYLISNRPDYLRHSALNYTAEQKHFNNRLTEGLLEVAARMNYVFDETCFNFVAVRDRIRCYYKSYVQSSKKRGVVVGFPSTHDDGTMGIADNHDDDYGFVGAA